TMAPSLTISKKSSFFSLGRYSANCSTESQRARPYLPNRAVALAAFIVMAEVEQTLRPAASIFLLSLSGGEEEDGDVEC
ncbi:hypothetical protein NDU88_005186, partial [Pleurodeles waltl]